MYDIMQKKYYNNWCWGGKLLSKIHEQYKIAPVSSYFASSQRLRNYIQIIVNM